MSQSNTGIKLLRPHKPGCFEVDRNEGSPFVVHDRQRFDLRTNGAAGGSTMWHIFRCNDPACPALAGVRYDVLSDFIGDPR